MRARESTLSLRASRLDTRVESRDSCAHASFKENRDAIGHAEIVRRTLVRALPLLLARFFAAPATNYRLTSSCKHEGALNEVTSQQ